MKLRLSKLALLLVIFTGVSYAYEPPYTSVEEAIKKGYVSFIGRVIRIEEMDHQEYFSTAIASVKVIKTLYGIDAIEGQEISVKYHSRLFTDYPNPGFPLELNISDTILFVINRPVVVRSSPLYFNSYYLSPSGVKPIDLAYLACDEPQEGFSLHREPQIFSSLYWPRRQRREEISTAKLFDWAKSRKAELERH